ncbi:ABC transporter ATP-binding protein [Kaarinaea lacus]
MNQPVLVVEGLGKDVPNLDPESTESLVILNDINLGIQRGESLAIVGPSGSGKSTLLGIMAGLDTPTRGRVFLNGTDITSLNEDKRAILRSEKLGFVFQSFQLLPTFTALENVMLPLDLVGNERGQKLAEQILSRVGLEKRLNHYPSQLSGGEQQRVAIARAFVSQPELLLADEPTGNLDQQTGQRIIDLMFELNKERGTTLVLVTHDYALADRCDRILTLHDGRLVNTGRSQ